MKFKARELMSGYWEPGKNFSWHRKTPLQFDIVWEIDSLSNLFSGDGASAAAGGVITIGNHTDPCKGRLTFDYFGEHRIIYDLRWETRFFTFGNYSHQLSYQLLCEKRNIQLWNLPYTHLNAEGFIFERATGVRYRANPSGVVGKVKVKFPLRTTLKFLSSFKLKRG